MICSCGLQSTETCRNMFETILSQQYTEFRYAAVHRLTVDTCALQHPTKPAMLTDVDTMTIAQVAQAKDATDHVTLGREWAADV